jgi:hypothetical protein
MMAINFLLVQFGGPPPPLPPERPWTGSLRDWISLAIPLVIAGLCLLAMLISVLFRYSERFREFWATHVCGWMEEYTMESDETKGGR